MARPAATAGWSGRGSLEDGKLPRRCRLVLRGESERRADAPSLTPIDK